MFLHFYTFLYFHDFRCDSVIFVVIIFYKINVMSSTQTLYVIEDYYYNYELNVYNKQIDIIILFHYFKTNPICFYLKLSFSDL